MDTDVLIISSDEQVRQLVQTELSLEGYSVLAEQDGTSGFITARKTQPRLLIVEMGIPGLSAMEICNRLRMTNTELKIILLTDGDKALSVDLPVDDFIFTPMGLTELLLRVERNLCQQPARSESILRFEDVSLNLESHEAHRGSRRVELTPKEFELLTNLLQNPQQVVTRDRLLEEVWGYDFGGSHNVLHVCIRSLRNKLEANGEDRLIQTVRGVGYVLRPFSSDFSSTCTRLLASLSH